MVRNLIIGFIGQDRPGLISSLTQVVSEHGGNWLESRMSRLAGHFAGTARIEVDEANVDALQAALRSMDHLTFLFREPGESEEADTTRAMRLNIIGPDRPGILREISNELARQVINVVEMETRVSAAPMSGELTFMADAQIRVPLAANVAALVEKLNSIADDLGVDILLDEEPELR